jgi:hypothetical protein
LIRLIRVKPPGARRFAARSSAPCKDLAYYWRHPLGHTCVFPLEEQLAAMGMIVAGSWLVGAISTPRHAPRTSTETSAAAIARRPGSQS